jgi:hypothetical protein
VLVVCNGAYKSGSSWLFHIVSELGEFRHPEAEFQDSAWRRVPTIAPDRLAAFIAAGRFRSADYICKTHYDGPRPRRLLIGTEAAFVLDIRRDLRDVVVSAYHYHVGLGRFFGDFERFYWIEGRLVADRVVRYHRLWEGAPDKVLVASYERLHSDFDGEVARIAGFLGLPPSPERLGRVRERTSLGHLRQRYGEDAREAQPRFYRKGEVGDWRNYMTPAMLADLAAIEDRGLPLLARATCVIQTKAHRAVRAWPRTRLRPLIGRF